jgi:hypothetical protein
MFVPAVHTPQLLFASHALPITGPVVHVPGPLLSVHVAPTPQLPLFAHAMPMLAPFWHTFGVPVLWSFPSARSLAIPAAPHAIVPDPEFPGPCAAAFTAPRTHAHKIPGTFTGPNVVPASGCATGTVPSGFGCP